MLTVDVQLTLFVGYVAFQHSTSNKKNNTDTQTRHLFVGYVAFQHSTSNKKNNTDTQTRHSLYVQYQCNEKITCTIILPKTHKSQIPWPASQLDSRLPSSRYAHKSYGQLASQIQDYLLSNLLLLQMYIFPFKKCSQLQNYVHRKPLPYCK